MHRKAHLPDITDCQKKALLKGCGRKMGCTKHTCHLKKETTKIRLTTTEASVPRRALPKTMRYTKTCQRPRFSPNECHWSLTKARTDNGVSCRAKLRAPCCRLARARAYTSCP